MSSVILQSSTGWNIRSVEGAPDSWQILAPPQQSNQWRDGYSAKELAKLWFRNKPHVELPAPFRALLESEESLRGVEVETGICEVVTRIDNFGGNHRNHDQILLGRSGSRRTVVGVEAKRLEEFGPIIKEYLYDPKKGGKEGSNIPARIELLARSVFGRPSVEVASLRYQLLHAFAGTVIEAKRRGGDLAVFLVCEFTRKDSDPKKVESNHRDFEEFVRAFRGFESTDVRVGRLFGPIEVHGGQFVPTGIMAFIGKVKIDLDS